VERSIFMKFRSLFLALAPDAEMEKHRKKIETGKYILYINLAQDQQEALDLAKNYVKDKGIHSMILCPGFDHEDVAEISDTVGKEVGVTVARGDGPSDQISTEAMEDAGWFD
ncbi:MAG: DUF6506 family protein, partial [Candidatus Thermoplasmatota archaeon]